MKDALAPCFSSVLRACAADDFVALSYQAGDALLHGQREVFPDDAKIVYGQIPQMVAPESLPCAIPAREARLHEPEPRNITSHSTHLGNPG